MQSEGMMSNLHDEPNTTRMRSLPKAEVHVHLEG
jgi:hypothetical protein